MRIKSRRCRRGRQSLLLASSSLSSSSSFRPASAIAPTRRHANARPPRQLSRDRTRVPRVPPPCHIQDVVRVPPAISTCSSNIASTDSAWSGKTWRNSGHEFWMHMHTWSQYFLRALLKSVPMVSLILPYASGSDRGSEFSRVNWRKTISKDSEEVVEAAAWMKIFIRQIRHNKFSVFHSRQTLEKPRIGALQFRLRNSFAPMLRRRQKNKWTTRKQTLETRAFLTVKIARLALGNICCLRTSMRVLFGVLGMLVRYGLLY